MATRKSGQEEINFLKRWLSENQDSVSEKVSREFTELVLKDFPAKHIIATNSAMGAMHIAMQSVGVSHGDEVIVDPIVVFGGMAAMYQNATPVFADIDPRTFNMSVASLKERITDKTKAIIVTHLFGSIADMKGILAVAKEKNIPVLEDCAHALWAEQDGIKAGLHGDFSSFSFNHRKQLSTGQGGFLLVNNEKYVESAKKQGFGRVPSRLTWNYAMSGIIAGMAISQWKYAKGYVEEDQKLAKLYSEAVEDCSWIVPQEIPKNNKSAFHIWGAEFRGEEIGLNYEDFMAKLKDNGGTYFLPSFIPNGVFGLTPSPAYLYPIFQEVHPYKKGLCPNAEKLVPKLFNTVLSPVPEDRIRGYAAALKKTVKELSALKAN